MELQIKYPDQLKTDIDNIKSQLTDLQKNFAPKKPEAYLSRAEVSKMLQVSYVTLNKWNRSKKLKAVGIGGRVLYRQSDIDKAIVEL